MVSKQTTLVTGSPRSGTTWVGRTLASAPQTSYLLEPMNLRRAGYFDLPLTHWYQRLQQDSNTDFADVFDQLLAGKQIGRGEPLGFESMTAPIATAKQLMCHVRDRYVARNSCRIVVKDPIALLSADWFADRYDAKIVITIRHPAAVVSSLRMRNWSPDFEDLLQQPEVVDEFFPDIEAWLRQHPRASNQDPKLYNASVLWRLFHCVILKYQTDHPNWIFVRHEDLSRATRSGFTQLFDALDFPWTSSTDAFLDATTSQDLNNYVRESVPTNDIARNTDGNIKIWLERLSSEEIAEIRTLTEDVARHFYTDDDWLPDPA